MLDRSSNSIVLVLAAHKEIKLVRCHVLYFIFNAAVVRSVIGMNGLYFIPIFSAVLVGMPTKRVPAIAAKVGLVVGFTVIASGYIVPVLASYVSAIHEFHFLGLVIVSLIALMLIIGRLSPREEAWQHKHSGDVELTPWPLAWPLGIGLVVFVLGIYVWFAGLSALDG